MNNNNFKRQILSSEEYGEFKGTTNTKLEIIYKEVISLRCDVNELKGWKAYVIGVGSVVGFLGGFIGNFFKK